jgi:prevent-host-death family protein
MKTVDIHAAKTHLSSLVEEAAAGEEIVIAKAGKPVARLVALKEPDFRETFGMLKGKIRVSGDFDAPLAPETLRAFGGGRPRD